MHFQVYRTIQGPSRTTDSVDRWILSNFSKGSLAGFGYRVGLWSPWRRDMTFHRPIPLGSVRAKSEGNPDACSGCLKEAFRNLSAVAKTFGISTGALHTLRAMIHCVRPGQSLTCFASTETLIRLRSGGSDRTVRRHVGELIEAGVIHRHDSPNKKRYMVRDLSSGQVLLFGFDLSPMLAREDEWKRAADLAAAEISRKRYLKTLILGRLHKLDLLASGIETNILRTILRRNLSIHELEGVLSNVEYHLTSLTVYPCSKSEAVEQNATQAPCPPGRVGVSSPTKAPCPGGKTHEQQGHKADASSTTSVSGGQNDRHQHRSDTYILETNPARYGRDLEGDREEEELLRKVVETCTEATAFAEGPVESWEDIHALGWLLAPIIGIDKEMMVQAISTHGLSPVTTLVLLLLQKGDTISNIGGYFRSLTLGVGARTFDPWRMLGPSTAPSTNAPPFPPTDPVPVHIRLWPPAERCRMAMCDANDADLVPAGTMPLGNLPQGTSSG